MKALVLSGGGCKGAYQAGVLKHLMGDLGTRYDAICGVSAGALNASYLSMFPIGKELEASDALVKLWQTTRNKDVWRNWCPFHKVSALWKPSLLDSTPLQKLVRGSLDVDRIRASGRQLRVGAVSLTTGDYREFDEKYHDVPGAVLASSSFPGMLTPIELDGQLYTDGGPAEITPIKSAIDLGADEIDCIICAPVSVPKTFTKKPNAISVAMRAIDIMTDNIIVGDIEITNYYNKLVEAGQAPDGKRFIKFRVIRPDHALTDDPLEFDADILNGMIGIGYEDGKKATSFA